MQSAAFKAAGIEATYEKHRVSPSALGAWVQRARDVPFAGFNVTIPHKEAIASFLDAVDVSVDGVGAVNTVVSRAGSLTGYNTDLPGFSATVNSLQLDIRGGHAVVLGAGGSARAVARALSDLGAHITVCNRDVENARELAVKLSIEAEAASFFSPEARRVIETADLVVNTTPLGMDHLSISPLPDGTKLDRRTAVIDLVYGRTTPLVTQAQASGCIVIDGIEMLVQQGAAAFRLWTGITPDLEVMRAACRRALTEVHTCSAS
jgi:shikimate dehydrogenase